MTKRLMISICVYLLLAGTAHAIHETVFEEARSLVEEAVTFLKVNGKEKAVAEISRRDGSFVRGSLYVFAYDLNGTMVAHPLSPDLIGKNLVNEPDVKGKLFRKQIVELARTMGAGWVDYTYWNPKTRGNEPKTTYFQKEGDLIICCGAYAVPPPLLGG